MVQEDLGRMVLAGQDKTFEIILRMIFQVDHQKDYLQVFVSDRPRVHLLQFLAECWNLQDRMNNVALEEDRALAIKIHSFQSILVVYEGVYIDLLLYG
jgi:hypothetical protein